MICGGKHMSRAIASQEALQALAEPRWVDAPSGLSYFVQPIANEDLAGLLDGIPQVELIGKQASDAPDPEARKRELTILHRIAMASLVAPTAAGEGGIDVALI